MQRVCLTLCAAALAGCSIAPSTPSPAAIPSGASVIAGGCGSTAILQGGPPEWINEAAAHNSPNGTPYVLATPQKVAGFLFTLPLRSGHPENPYNKILWVVDDADASRLLITAHPTGAATPIVEDDRPRAQPGAIFPSILDMPEPGCWHLDLSWSSRKASVDLLYV